MTEQKISVYPSQIRNLAEVYKMAWEATDRGSVGSFEMAVECLASLEKKIGISMMAQDMEDLLRRATHYMAEKNEIEMGHKHVVTAKKKMRQLIVHALMRYGNDAAEQRGHTEIAVSLVEHSHTDHPSWTQATIPAEYMKDNAPLTILTKGAEK